MRLPQVKIFFPEVKSPIPELDLPYEKLSCVITDRAPSMVGHQKGFVALIKKELENRHLDSKNFIVLHNVTKVVNVFTSLKIKGLTVEILKTL